MMNLPALLLVSLTLASPSLQLQGGKSAVKYLGDTFLLPDGCPSDNPLVQRYFNHITYYFGIFSRMK